MPEGMPGASKDDADQIVIEDVYSRMNVICNVIVIVRMADAKRITPLAAGGPDAADWVEDWTGRFSNWIAEGIEWTSAAMHEWQDQMWRMFNEKIRYDSGNLEQFRWLRTALRPERRVPYRMLNRYWFHAQQTLPGRVRVYTGQKDGGKTDTLMKGTQDMILLKRDHLAHLAAGTEEESELFAMWAYLLHGAHSFDAQRYKKDGLGLLFAKDIRIVTNVDVKKIDEHTGRENLLFDYYQFASTLSDTYILINQNALNGYFSLGAFDEIGKAMPVIRTASQSNLSMMDWLREIRKPNCSIDLATQDLRRDLGARVGTDERMGIRSFVTKINPRRAVYQVDGISALQWQLVTGIPKAGVPFMSRDSASFKADVIPKVLTEAVDIIRKVARDQGYEWTLHDTFRMTIQVAQRIRSLELVATKPGADDPRNSLAYLLGSVTNPKNGKAFSPNEIQKYTGETLEEIERKLDMVARTRVQKSAMA